MASLLIVGSLILHHRIKDKKEAKREKKRQQYEDRYSELQREHAEYEAKYLQRTKTGESLQREKTGDDSVKLLQQHTSGSQSSLRSAESPTIQSPRHPDFDLSK